METIQLDEQLTAEQTSRLEAIKQAVENNPGVFFKETENGRDYWTVKTDDPGLRMVLSANGAFFVSINVTGTVDSISLNRLEQAYLKKVSEGTSRYNKMTYSLSSMSKSPPLPETVKGGEYVYLQELNLETADGNKWLEDKVVQARKLIQTEKDKVVAVAREKSDQNLQFIAIANL